jgi:hypothetical protein
MMRILTITLVLIISTVVAGQEKDQEKWSRVYTYEDSVVEINETTVIFVNKDVSRILSRTVYSKPQSMKEKADIKYKTRLETIEFKCSERRYRIYRVRLLDSKGNTVDSYDSEETAEWKTAKAGGIMERLMAFGCRLAAGKKIADKPIEKPETTDRPVLRRRP